MAPVTLEQVPGGQWLRVGADVGMDVGSDVGIKVGSDDGNEVGKAVGAIKTYKLVTVSIRNMMTTHI
jgi:hypothetical protein